MTLGEVLKKYREKNKITIEEFSNITKIPQKVILSLESDDVKSLSSESNVKNYIKIYSRYLKLDEKKLLNLYTTSPDNKISEIKVKKQKKSRIYLTPRIIKIATILAIAIILISYLIFQVSKIFVNPYLEVTVPHKDLVVTDNFVELRGVTEKEATVYINDKEIYTDSNGYFQITLDLNQGINLIKISSKKKHSKESVIFREILVK